MSILSGIDVPTSGNVILNDDDFYSFSAKKQEEFRNNNIGIVFQNYHLIPELTCEENISMLLVFSKRNITDDKVMYVMNVDNSSRF